MIGIARIDDILAMSTVEALDDPTLPLDVFCVKDILHTRRSSDRYPALLKEIRASGISVPVLIRTCDGEPWLLDGHHRVTAAVDLGLQFVPWTDVPLGVDWSDLGPLSQRHNPPWTGYAPTA